jgi:hypothetical protein
MRSDENLDLWVEGIEWPEPPLNFVLLLQLVVLVAREMLGADWGEPFAPANHPKGFERVSRVIAEAGEARQLDVCYVHPNGTPVPLGSADWCAWRSLFFSGHLRVEIDPGPVRYAGVSYIYSCPIVVRRNEKLDRFIRGIRPPAQAPAGPQLDLPPPSRLPDEPTIADLAQAASRVQTEVVPPAIQPNDPTAGIQTSAPTQGAPGVESKLPRTGFAGRPTARDLIEGELDRRIGELKPGEYLGSSITGIAKSLSSWLWNAHRMRTEWKTVVNTLAPKIRPHVSQN